MTAHCAASQASKSGGANGSSSPADPQWAGDGGYGGSEEGPAARAVRELELQLAAAEKDALRSVDYSTDTEVSCGTGSCFLGTRQTRCR